MQTMQQPRLRCRGQLGAAAAVTVASIRRPPAPHISPCCWPRAAGWRRVPAAAAAAAASGSERGGAAGGGSSGGAQPTKRKAGRPWKAVTGSGDDAADSSSRGQQEGKQRGPPHRGRQQRDYKADRQRAAAKARQAAQHAGLLPGDAAAAGASGVPDANLQQRAAGALQLQELLGSTSAAQLEKVFKRAPGLLMQPLAELQQRLAALATLLGGDAAAAKAACRKQPKLLTLGTEAMQHNAAQLQALLDLNDQELAKVVSSQLSLLGRSPDTLASKLQALAAHFGSKQAAVKACVRSPQLLSQDIDSVAAKAAALQALLGLESSEQLAPLLRRVPGLLTWDPDSLKANMQQLEKRLPMSRGEVQEMAVAQPSLLAIVSQAVAAKWRLLTAYTGPGGSRGLAIKALALTYSLDRLARLEYLSTVVAAADRSAKLPAVSTVLPWSDAKFNARYPGFPGWLAANAARLEDENPPMKLRGKDAAAAAAAARDPTKQRPRARRRGGVVGDAAAADDTEGDD